MMSGDVQRTSGRRERKKRRIWFKSLVRNWLIVSKSCHSLARGGGVPLARSQHTSQLWIIPFDVTLSSPLCTKKGQGDHSVFLLHLWNISSALLNRPVRISCHSKWDNQPGAWNFKFGIQFSKVGVDTNKAKFTYAIPEFSEIFNSNYSTIGLI
jgi:hypothetical protein